MKLSSKSRYAVMAMVDLSNHCLNAHDIQAPLALTSISNRQNLPLPYLEQIFNKLRRANLVKSARGVNGGFSLSRSPSEIYINDIILAVDTPLKATRCDSGSKVGCQPGGAKCQTHDLWKELGTLVHLFFEHITLEDVCKNKHLGMGYLFFKPVKGKKESNELVNEAKNRTAHSISFVGGCNHDLS